MTNPLRQQMENLASAPGVATNPFEAVLAKWGIVRDDVRRAALQQHTYANNRETDLAYAAKNRDAAVEHGLKLSNSLPDNVESYESSPLGGVSMRRRHVSSVPPKQDSEAGKSANPTTKGGATINEALGNKPKKRDATIKDVEAAIGAKKIDKEQGAEASKSYAAKQGRKAAAKQVRQADAPPTRSKSNVGPQLADVQQFSSNDSSTPAGSNPSKKGEGL